MPKQKNLLLATFLYQHRRKLDINCTLKSNKNQIDFSSSCRFSGRMRGERPINLFRAFFITRPDMCSLVMIARRRDNITLLLLMPGCRIMVFFSLASKVVEKTTRQEAERMKQRFNVRFREIILQGLLLSSSCFFNSVELPSTTMSLDGCFSWVFVEMWNEGR